MEVYNSALEISTRSSQKTVPINTNLHHDANDVITAVNENPSAITSAKETIHLQKPKTPSLSNSIENILQKLNSELRDIVTDIAPSQANQTASRDQEIVRSLPGLYKEGLKIDNGETHLAPENEDSIIKDDFALSKSSASIHSTVKSSHSSVGTLQKLNTALANKEQEIDLLESLLNVRLLRFTLGKNFEKSRARGQARANR
jgi:hypothetical protein